MAALKYSKQRESIKEFLATRKDHPTADTIYTNIREKYPNISLGTVYRNLALLSRIGEISKITTGEGPDHFDSNIDPHHHFVCEKCFRVIDLEMENIDYIMDLAGKKFGGKIKSYATQFSGICDNCLE